MIAHRLSTVRNADKIVVLGSPEGTSTALTGSVILEQGSHDELLQLENGFYRALVGTGTKSSGLVDDTEFAKTETASTGSGLLDLKDKVDAASEKSTAAASTDDDESGGFSLFGKKTGAEAEKEAAEKKRLAANKARVWTYTKVRWNSSVSKTYSRLLAYLEMLKIAGDGVDHFWIIRKYHQR